MKFECGIGRFRSNRARAAKVRIKIWFLAICALTPPAAALVSGTAYRSTAQSQSIDISNTALNQIRSLMEAKAARTPAQQRIDSNILAALKAGPGESMLAAAPMLQLDLEVDRDGDVLVDIDANVSADLVHAIKNVGGEIISSSEEYGAVRARVPVAEIERLAGSDDVRFIYRAAPCQTQRQGRNQEAAVRDASITERSGNVRARFSEALDALRKKTVIDSSDQDVSIMIGSATSQGDIAHRAAQARSTFGVNGSGVKVGVLSDSYNNLGGASADVSGGDLPGPGNPNGFTTAVTVIQDLSSGGADEGRAMLQIVHDLAPGAQLYFATAFTGPAGFANNIKALRNAGCDIIIDDVFYLNESPFQDDIISQAVNTVTSSGALYFSSAGNSGNLNDGTAGVWEGDFNDSGTDLIVGGTNFGRLHRFSAGSILNTCTGGTQRRVDLFWSDALGQSANDFDLYILDSTATNVVRISDNAQTGTQNPYEAVNTLNVGEKIAVVKFSGANRFINISTGRGRLAIATAGQERGHACAVNALSVAAVNVATAAGGAFAGGAGNPVETFTSDGPRRVFYNSDGTAITPGNFSSSGGTTRQKPDVAAADGVSTTLPSGTGLNPFFGTSAAAPHAGAIAALVKSANPALTDSQIRTILMTTALDIEAVGIDRDSGVGIVMAFPAVQAANPGATSILTVASQNPNSGASITVSPNDTAGQGSGLTQFSRIYNNNTTVTLTAPATAAGNAFQKWRKDGVDVSTSVGISVLMDANHTMTAVYTPPPNYAGFIDSADCNLITGWAADKNRLNTSINVSIYDGATLLTTVLANQLRSDVGSFLGDNGLHGFAVATPASLKDGQTHTVRVKFEASATELGNSPKSINCSGGSPNYAGFIDSADCNLITGWAADKNRLNTSINVSIYDGATLLTTVLANALRPDVGSFLGDNGLHGFAVATPASLKDGQTHTVRVKFESSATELGNSPKSINCSGGSPNYAGFIDSADCNLITGWAADKNRLNTSINVSIYDGATLLTTVLANQLRPDVGSFLGDNGLHGFAVATPASLKDGQTHTVRVKFESSATELGNSPRAINCDPVGVDYAGFIDLADCNIITGWAADKNRLNTSINVSIYDGATLLTTVLANQLRPDVGSFLGDNGLHGFAVATPASLKDGQTHTVRVKFEASATELGHSPATVSGCSP